MPLGALIVARSALVDVRPFQLGLGVALAGLLLTLGDAQGGAVGDGLERVVALGLGTTGATILGVLLTIAGATFLTGTSLGAVLRRTGHVVHLAHKRVRSMHAEPRPSSRGYPAREEAFEPPIDVKHDYPDLVTDSVSVGPAPMLYDARAGGRSTTTTHESQEQLFPTPLEPVGEYVLPDRSLLKKSQAGRRAERRSEPARRRGARHVPRALRRRGDRDRPDLRPARHPLRAAARARARRSARSRT